MKNSLVKILKKVNKSRKSYFILGLFAFSWLLLFFLTANRTPWNLTDKSLNEGEIMVNLGDVPVQNYNRMGFTGGNVQYVKAENAWIVGTDKGDLFLFSSRGEIIWKHALGAAKLESLSLSEDGSTAYVGEAGAEGNFYAIDTATGNINWKKSMAEYVGTEPQKRSYPSAVHIVTDRKGNIYLTAHRFRMNRKADISYFGRVISLDKQGKERWKFPEDEIADTWVNWCDVNSQGDTLVFSTSNYNLRPELKYKKTFYFLDSEKGQIKNSVFIPAIEPFENTVTRTSPNYSRDGKYLAAMASDGRGFYFNAEGKLLWRQFISKPTRIDGAWLNASGRDAFILPEGVLFSTISTYNRENWQLPTPVCHPSDNSIFLFSPQGKFIYQFRAAGSIEGLAIGKDSIYCAIGRNIRTHNYSAHGIAAVDLVTGEKRNFLPFDGPCQAVAVNDTETLVAAIEAPAMTPAKEIIGAYRLHIIPLSKKTAINE